MGKRKFEMNCVKEFIIGSGTITHMIKNKIILSNVEKCIGIAKKNLTMKSGKVKEEIVTFKYSKM